MALYTERYGLRKPIVQTSFITREMYDLLFDCCERYFNYMAWRFPEECPDGDVCCGLDHKKFNTNMKFDIPTLYRNSNGWIDKPGNDHFSSNDKYDQYALLDLIEFIGQNCRDILIEDFHSYFRHHHINILETNKIFNDFRKDINSVFQKTGLLFSLTDKAIIERIIESGPLTSETEIIIKSAREQGVKDLLEEAIMLFKQPNPATRNDAVEKIWDALERLKTYYTNLEKNGSVKKIIKDMSNGQSEFEQLFDTEFRVLTNIGNNYRIRHHETDKIDIQDTRHYDYFFNRCLSLIVTTIQYLQ